MSSQIGNNNIDQFSGTKMDLTLYGSPIPVKSNKNVGRRASSFVKVSTEDHQTEDSHHKPARLTRSDARRGSSFIRAMSEDIGDDSRYLGGKSLSPNFRRGSSFLSTGEDYHEDHLSTPKTPKDIRRGSSFIKTSDDSLEDSPRRLDVRRGSSFIRMISEDINNDDLHSTGRLSSKPESRRSSGVVKMMSEDPGEDYSSRRSSTVRRGSSFSRMISEEDTDISATSAGKSTNRSEISDKHRKSLDSYRRSLESISEYKTHTFSSASLYPSIDFSSLSVESSSDFSTDFAIRTNNDNTGDATDRNTDCNTDRLFVNSSLSYLSWIESVTSTNDDYLSNPNPATTCADDNRSGEWNSFWTNYNNSRNDYYSSPYLCHSNSGEDLSLDSNSSTQRGFTDKSVTDNIVLTVDEVNEALKCTQRLMEILRGAIKRSENDVLLSKSDDQNFTKEEQKIDEKKDKTLFKSSNNSCIDVILNHTGVADILKRVINKRRDVIMPPDEPSTPKK